MPRYKIGLAGYGKMGQAMVAAWRNNGFIESIDILDPNISSIEVSSPCPTFHYFTQSDDFFGHCHEWDILVLAVKPQTLETLFQSKQEMAYVLIYY